MHNMISSISECDKLIYNNLIELMQSIKENSLKYQYMRYEMAIISDAFWSKFTSIKNYGKSLQDYTRQFKTSI